MKEASVFALLLVMGAASAHAQTIEIEAPLENTVLLPSAPTQPPPSEALPPPPSLDAALVPQGYGDSASRWASAPGGPEGIIDPILVTSPDHDLLLAGTVLLTVSYTIASVLSTMFGTAFGCSWWGGACEPAIGALGVLPIAHFAAGFSNTSAAAGAYITGGIFAPIEIVGLILLIAGASHHHPALVPRQRPRAGAPALELATF